MNFPIAIIGRDEIDDHPETYNDISSESTESRSNASDPDEELSSLKSRESNNY